MIRLDGKGEKLFIDDQDRLVAEWYDFGGGAAYEFADMLIFDDAAQSALADALGVGDVRGLPLASALAARFNRYYLIKEFVVKRGLPVEKEVDFSP